MSEVVQDLEEVLKAFGKGEAIRHAKSQIKDLRDGLRLIDRQLIALQKDAIRMRRSIRELQRFQGEKLGVKRLPTGKRKGKKRD